MTEATYHAHMRSPQLTPYSMVKSQKRFFKISNKIRRMWCLRSQVKRAPRRRDLGGSTEKQPSDSATRRRSRVEGALFCHCREKSYQLREREGKRCWGLGRQESIELFPRKEEERMGERSTVWLLVSGFHLCQQPRISSADFPSGPVAESLPANSEDMGSIPGPRRFYMPWGQVSLWVPQLPRLRAVTIEARTHLEPMLCKKSSHCSEKASHT